MTASNLFRPPGLFLKHLQEIGFLSHRAPVLDQRFEVHYLDLTPLKLDVQIFTPFVMSKEISGKNVIDKEVIASILVEIRKKYRLQDAPHLFLLVGGRVLGRGTLLPLLRKTRTVVLDRPHMVSLMETASLDTKHQILASHMIEILGRESLSPYQPGQPVFGARFFGRSHNVHYILSRRDASFTIIGNRRIGKTSLLREIRHRIAIDEPSTLTADLYGSNLHNTAEVLSSILTRLGLSDPREKFDPERPGKQRFVEVIHNAARRSRIAVFIDEIDHLLELDQLQGWRIFDTLRDTFDHSECRLFLAGFRHTRNAKQLLGCPLYNFADSLELQRLSRDEAVDMVTRPMRMLKIDLRDSDIPQAIFRETGGQPELIQIFCKHLIDVFEKTGAIPTTGSLMTKVLASEELEQRISQTFLANTSPLEELTCYLLIKEAEDSASPIEDFEFRPADSYALLQSVGVTLDMHLITNMLRNLELAGIISPSPGVKVRQYHFSIPQLARYCISLDLELCIVSALESVNKHPNLIDALLFTPGRDDR